MRGAEILVKALQAENVKYIWGYPGGAVLHIYDAFYKQETIEHVLVRHEQAAVHAADGFARATGEVGVALVTSGPGLTNAVTGIATAYMDSIPMVIISGQVHLPADDHHWNAVHVSGGDAGYGIGQSGARSDQGHAHFTRSTGKAICSVNCSLLMANKNVLNGFLLVKSVVNVENGTTGVAPDVFDVLGLERFDQNFCATQLLTCLLYTSDAADE